jgi:hypothetical protein
LLQECVFHYNLYTGAISKDLGCWSKIKEREAKVCVKGLGVAYEFRTQRERKQANAYILQNAALLSEWRNKYDFACNEHASLRSAWRRSNPRGRYPPHLAIFLAFDEWFVKSVNEASDTVDETVAAFAQGFSSQALRYKRLLAFGTSFRTADYDKTIKSTCDSLVVGTFYTASVASAVDVNPIEEELTFVGEITDIISVTYGHMVEVVLLRVQWYKPIVEEDVSRGLISTPRNAIRKRDETGFQLVNQNNLASTWDEPFVLVENVSKAFLAPSNHEEEPGLSIVVPVQSDFSYVKEVAF